MQCQLCRKQGGKGCLPLLLLFLSFIPSAFSLGPHSTEEAQGWVLYVLGTSLTSSLQH